MKVPCELTHWCSQPCLSLAHGSMTAGVKQHSEFELQKKTLRGLFSTGTAKREPNPSFAKSRKMAQIQIYLLVYYFHISFKHLFLSISSTSDSPLAISIKKQLIEIQYQIKLPHDTASNFFLYGSAIL